MPPKKEKTIAKKPDAEPERKLRPKPVKNEEPDKEKKKKTVTATSKKAKSVGDPEPTVADENEIEKVKKKTTRGKKPTENKTVENGTEEKESKEKKTAAAKVKRGKKVAESQPAEEEPTDTKQGRKRKAPQKTKEEPKNTESGTKVAKVNATSTDWDKIDFTCNSKNSKGQAPNFHITSWNVDGLRAWMNKGGLNIIEYDKPDILCLQETKCGMDKLPDDIKNLEGYETLWCCSDKDGYAGVGIATKIKPISVDYGINSEDHDTEGRCITAEYEKFFLVNVYVPNAGRKLVTLPKRLEWNDIFKEYINSLNERKPVIVCGDMNVAHSPIDLANPKTNTKNAGFTIEERNGMTDFLENGYIDTFRHFYPEKEKAYTFWTYMAGARSKNVGWRLDYFLVSEKFMENVCDNVIHSEVLGSDHCPISLHINI